MSFHHGASYVLTIILAICPTRQCYGHSQGSDSTSDTKWVDLSSDDYIMGTSGASAGQHHLIVGDEIPSCWAQLDAYIKGAADTGHENGKGSQKAGVLTSVVLKTFIRYWLESLNLHGSTADVDVSFLGRLKLSKNELLVLERFLANDNPDIGAAQDCFAVLRDMMSGVHRPVAEDDARESWVTKVRPAFEYVLLMCNLVLLLPVSVFWFGRMLRIRMTGILFMLFVISVGWNWNHMYMIKKAERMARINSYPSADKCIRQYSVLNPVANVFSDVYSYFFKWKSQGGLDPQCAQTYRDMMVDPFWEVTPFQAISVTLSSVFMEPFKELAVAVRSVLETLVSGVPLAYKFVIIPLFLIILIKIFMFVFGSSIDFSLLFGLVSLRMQTGPTGRIGGMVEQPAMYDEVRCRRSAALVAGEAGEENTSPPRIESAPSLLEIIPVDDDTAPKDSGESCRAKLLADEKSKSKTTDLCPSCKFGKLELPSGSRRESEVPTIEAPSTPTASTGGFDLGSSIEVVTTSWLPTFDDELEILSLDSTEDESGSVDSLGKDENLRHLLRRSSEEDLQAGGDGLDTCVGGSGGRDL